VCVSPVAGGFVCLCGLCVVGGFGGGLGGASRSYPACWQGLLLLNTERIGHSRHEIHSVFKIKCPVAIYFCHEGRAPGLEGIHNGRAAAIFKRFIAFNQHVLQAATGT